MDPDLSVAMEQASSLARKHHPHPNPRVGCVVLDRHGDVAGTGAHEAAGGSHAEVSALHEAGDRARGGIVVVTLEPCSHHGATPPCVDALLAAGVTKVVVGAIDPDQRVSGRGIEALRAAGVDVVMVDDPAPAEAIDPGYFHHRRTGRPFVTLKSAVTLDGQSAAADGTSRWITSEAARIDAHVVRSRSDAVAVGIGTVVADDPRLDVRLDGYTGPQPIPVVVEGARRLSTHTRLSRRDPLVFSPSAGADEVDLGEMLTELGRRRIVDLLVEGGPRLAGSLHRLGLVDRYIFYMAAAVAGGTGRPAFHGVFGTIGDEVRLEIVDVTMLGSDVRIDARRKA